MFTKVKNQTGQIVLILLLVLVVGLTIGLAVVQRSLTEVSTSSKTEQSARALSAAEAGIEKAIKIDSDIGQVSLGSEATINTVVKTIIPAQNQALEFPPISKEEMAQFWLTNPDTLTDFYNGADQNTNYIDVYFGNQGVIGLETPAIALNIIYKSTDTNNLYKVKKFYLDPIAARRSSNGFDDPTSCGAQCSCTSPSTTTSLSPAAPKPFFCKTRIDAGTAALPDLNQLLLIRARILYSNSAQSLAVAPAAGKSLPPQAKLFTSIGSSGSTQRTVQLFQTDKFVVLPFLDYSIFSAGEITKQ